jgi:hypothetical protein
MRDKELEILSNVTKKTLVKMYLMGNQYRQRDIDIWEYVKTHKTDMEFMAGLSASDNPKDYVLELVRLESR